MFEGCKLKLNIVTSFSFFYYNNEENEVMVWTDIVEFV